MIPKEYLGRYQFTDWSINSNKFWHIIYDMNKQTYLVTFGRNGTRGQNPLSSYDEKKAMSKIKEKIRKGYRKIEGYDETIGRQSIDFIKKFCGGE